VALKVTLVGFLVWVPDKLVRSSIAVLVSISYCVVQTWAKPFQAP
jgi:hypothetical protein